MRRLIIANTDSGAGAIKASRIAGKVIGLCHELVDGPAPLTSDPLEFFAARDALYVPDVEDWQTEINSLVSQRWVALATTANDFDRVELWVDPECNAQLQMVQFLDWIQAYPDIICKLVLVHCDRGVGEQPPEDVAGSTPSFQTITSDHLQTATKTWLAYRQPTPEAWFALLSDPFPSFPRLSATILQMLNELPAADTALGATQSKLLNAVSGKAKEQTRILGDLIGDEDQRPVFGYWTLGRMLDELAHCDVPLVVGLEDGPFDLALHDDNARLQRYRSSRLSLSGLGSALLEESDDNARHNRIDRWWGGTRLTNNRLWRWDRKTLSLTEPL